VLTTSWEKPSRRFVATANEYRDECLCLGVRG
jgi:hypothetical protein